MNAFYIYSFNYPARDAIEEKKVSATVIFCSSNEIDEKDIQAEIRTFYESNYQPDQIFVIGSNQIVPRLKEVFIDKQDQTFKGIPKRQDTHLSENMFLISFNKDGAIKCENRTKIPRGFEEAYKNEGLQQMFINRGGLIVSESSHHYVFPSGKHCDRFLRTGNILLYSPEIYFIAFCALRHFNEELYSRIYCDTSSINSIAFALFDLKNSFLGDRRKKVSIESFNSYAGLYDSRETYTKDSFLLISASTSSNIIKYVLDNHRILERDNIIILYFLGGHKDFSNVKDQVLCNLTQSKNNENGIPFYPTYLERDCEFCKRGSYAVPVTGDVFLLEKPSIKRVLLSVDDRQKNLSGFVKQFMSEKKGASVFKVHYKERSENKYEVYIDFVQLLNNMEGNSRFFDYKTKLDNYIQQYVPASTSYLLHLNDEGSEKFARYISGRITSKLKEENSPSILSQDQINSISLNASGTVVVVGSCVSNGKNLLYISRALRNFSQLRIVYFIAILRTSNKKYQVNLASNLKRGKYGGETNSFIAVETLYCSNNSKDTPWVVETEFLKDIILFIQNEKPEFSSTLSFFEERKLFLEIGSGSVSKGISDDIFFPRITTEPPERLCLRKNFAFFDFEDYDQHVTQSDVYFTISNIINSLRNSENINRQLNQAVYMRSLLDPNNFSRFNDGVIQASILRTACADELSYSIDNALSLEMFNTLETLVRYHEQEQGEALLEFLFAIAIKKLTLTNSHLQALLDKIKSVCKKDLFLCLEVYIRERLIDGPLKQKTEPFAA